MTVNRESDHSPGAALHEARLRVWELTPAERTAARLPNARYYSPCGGRALLAVFGDDGVHLSAHRQEWKLHMGREGRAAAPVQVEERRVSYHFNDGAIPCSAIGKNGQFPPP